MLVREAACRALPACYEMGTWCFRLVPRWVHGPRRPGLRAGGRARQGLGGVPHSPARQRARLCWPTAPWAAQSSPRGPSSKGGMGLAAWAFELMGEPAQDSEVSAHSQGPGSLLRGRLPGARRAGLRAGDRARRAARAEALVRRAAREALTCKQIARCGLRRRSQTDRPRWPLPEVTARSG